MSHTPGPWRLWVSINDNDDNAGAFILRGDSPERHGEDMVIAKRDCGTPNPAEGIANARLLAAAPDLLAALRSARQFIRNGIELGYIRMPDPDSNDSALLTPGQIDAAIAKAEGR